MKLPERKRFAKLIPIFPIGWYLLLVIATFSILNPQYFEGRFNYFLYEVINCSYFSTIFCLIIAHVRRLCAYNWIAISGMLFTCIFNTVALAMDLPQDLYATYYKLYMWSTMIPIAMLAMLAVALNTRIQKLIDEYMNPKNKDT